MPVVVRWYLRTALVMFLLALVVGILQNLGQLIPYLPSGLNPVYFHLLMVGWITQFIFGIAIWMLPKYTQDKPRGNEGLLWSAYVLLNFGLLARAIGEPMSASGSGTVWGWLLVGSATAQWFAGVFFVINAWPRVRGK